MNFRLHAMLGYRSVQGLSRIGLAMTLLFVITLPTFAIGDNPPLDDSQVVHWQYQQAIQMPATTDVDLVDFVLNPQAFSHARADLGDVRLFDDSGQPVPYALRVLQATSRREAFDAEEFNRSIGPRNSSEITLDLKKANIEHNAIEVQTPGSNFRREVVLDGSDDNKTWSTLVKTTLIRFQRGKKKIVDDDISYPPSRFQHLRLRVYPDPFVDHGRIKIESVKVVKKIDLSGELVTLQADVGERTPVRGDGGPGSAWMIDLGGDRVPCDRISVEFDEPEFARNFYIESVGVADSYERFRRVALTGENMWQRRAGEPKKPMVAVFSEVRASRLKLVVTDFDNAPLKVRSIKFSAPARQIVFERPVNAGTKIELYLGNPEAELPNYDFARNLPTRLPGTPARAVLGAQEVNPRYVPPPLPLTDRWPWLIYVVLSCISLVLLLIIVSLARTSISIHDRRAATQGES